MEEERPETFLNDESLLRRFCAGDEEAAAQLYHKYAGRLLALVRARCSARMAPACAGSSSGSIRSWQRGCTRSVRSLPVPSRST